MPKDWHYTRSGNQVGPVSAADLKQLAATGGLSPTDMVWSDGMAAWAPASSVKGLFASPPLPPPVPPLPRPSAPSHANPAEPDATAAETESCAFCSTRMPSNAIQCSSCQNWRRDIHQLIQEFLKLKLGELATVIIGALLTLIVFDVGAAQPNARAPTRYGLGTAFSFERFMATPAFAVAFTIVFAAVGLWICLQVQSRRTRRKIELATNGLWKRPWWCY